MAGKSLKFLRNLNRLLYLAGTSLVLAGFVLCLNSIPVFARQIPILTVGQVHCVVDPYQTVKVNFIFSNIPQGQTPGPVNYIINSLPGSVAMYQLDTWTWKTSAYVPDGTVVINGAEVSLGERTFSLTYDGAKDGVYDCSDKCPNLDGIQLEVPDGMTLEDGNCVAITTETTPVVTETTPVVTETTPVVTETTPVVTETTPVVTETTPVVTETTPVVTETTPVVTETTPVVTETTPVVTETTPVVTDDPPDPTDDPGGTGGKTVEPLPMPAVSDVSALIPVTGAELAQPILGMKFLFSGVVIIGCSLILNGFRRRRG